ncbi:hypothetical protein [Streptomyces sp. NPDC056401]|uniref:hypothetical protein n=1 Tax=Streptomyces sp. NPDC056401 TaxID=3345809 RepID=UPI0035DBC954
MGAVNNFLTKGLFSWPRTPRWTFAAVWEERFGPGGARPRYGRTAEAAAEIRVSGRMVFHRPGSGPGLDLMPVKLRETAFGDAITATLTLALDLHTHGLPTLAR